MKIITQRNSIRGPSSITHPLVEAPFCLYVDVKKFAEQVSLLCDSYEEELRQAIVRENASQVRANRCAQQVSRLVEMAAIAQERMIKAENFTAQIQQDRDHWQEKALGLEAQIVKQIQEVNDEPR